MRIRAGPNRRRGPRLEVASATPYQQPVATAQPVVVVASQPVAPQPVVVVASQPVAPQPIVVASHPVVAQQPVVVASVAPPPPPPPVAPPPPPAGGSVAYQPAAGVAPPPPEPSKRRGSASALFGRAAALTKATVVGRLAPSRVAKSEVLALDGHPRLVKLGGGKLTIYESSTEASEKRVIFRAPIKFVRVVGDGHTASTVKQHRFGVVAPNEIRVYVEPEALNDEHNDMNGSGVGFGWCPGHLMVGPQAPMTAFAGDLKRQNFSLFAKDATAKHSWQTILTTSSNSSREWAYVKHEVKDTAKYVTRRKR